MFKSADRLCKTKYYAWQNLIQMESHIWWGIVIVLCVNFYILIFQGKSCRVKRFWNHRPHFTLILLACCQPFKWIYTWNVSKPNSSIYNSYFSLVISDSIIAGWLNYIHFLLELSFCTGNKTYCIHCIVFSVL